MCVGIPDEKRPIYWRILLGYLPKQTDRWESYLSKQRQLYHEISANLRIDSLLSTPRTADNNVANDDISVLHSIQVDVARTHPSLQFFIRDEQGAVGMLANPTLCLTRILFVYAKYNFGVRYTQGMNEICAALFYVFATDKDDCWREHAEADTYFCFMALMSELRDLFLVLLIALHFPTEQKCLIFPSLGEHG